MTAATEVSDPHLQCLIADAEANLAEVRALSDELTDAQLAWKPAPDVWSISECIGHLVRLDGLYLPRLEAAVVQARPGSGSAPPFRPSWFARRFHGFVKPGGGFRMKTMRALEPSQSLEGREVVDRFATQQLHLIDLIHRADGLDLNRWKFASPLSRFVRLSIGEAPWVLTAHQQRHLQQAHRVTQHPHFPPS